VGPQRPSQRGTDGALSGGDGVLFTGDHLAFSGRLNRLDGFARYGWDLRTQVASIRALAGLDYLWILPGHGRRAVFETADERRSAVEHCADEFERDPHGTASGRKPAYIQPPGSD
jgi:glyoxylase-like metal-dependent hydrolase (beta-lactamase superfamily II)